MPDDPLAQFFEEKSTPDPIAKFFGTGAAPSVAPPPSLEELRAQHKANYEYENPNLLQSASRMAEGFTQGVGNLVSGIGSLGKQVYDIAKAPAASMQNFTNTQNPGPMARLGNTLSGMGPADAIAGIGTQIGKYIYGTPEEAGEVIGENAPAAVVPELSRAAVKPIFKATGVGRGLQALREVPGRIAEAVELPKDYRGGAAKIKTSVPMAMQHAVENNMPITNMAEMSEASKGALKQFGTDYFNPLKENFGSHQLSPNPVLRNMTSKLTKADYVSNPGLRAEVRAEAANLRKLGKASDMLDYYHNLQAELEPYERAKPAVRAEKFKDSSWRFKIAERDALRDHLARHFDTQRARMEGTTVAALKEAGNDFASINRQYGALRSLTNLTDEAATRAANVGLRQEGAPWSSGVSTGEVLAPKRAILNRALETVTGANKTPDQLVGKAFADFQKHGGKAVRPTKMQAAVPLQQQQLPFVQGELGNVSQTAPQPGQTVPISVSPVPQPAPISGSSTTGYPANTNPITGAIAGSAETPAQRAQYLYESQNQLEAPPTPEPISVPTDIERRIADRRTTNRIAEKEYTGQERRAYEEIPSKEIEKINDYRRRQKAATIYRKYNERRKTPR